MWSKWSSGSPVAALFAMQSWTLMELLGRAVPENQHELWIQQNAWHVLWLGLLEEVMVGPDHVSKMDAPENSTEAVERDMEAAAWSYL